MVPQGTLVPRYGRTQVPVHTGKLVIKSLKKYKFWTLVSAGQIDGEIREIHDRKFSSSADRIALVITNQSSVPSPYGRVHTQPCVH